VATLSINADGHGFGQLGALRVTLTDDTQFSFRSGGRGTDLNDDRAIANNEGYNTPRPREILYRGDGARQTAADLMQLVRIIQVGMDVDGDGNRELNPGYISYLGFSQGSGYGAPFLGVEPDVRTSALNVPGVANYTWQRLAPGARPNFGRLLEARTPSLLNSPGLAEIDGVPVAAPHYNENIPLRNQPPVINTLDGATAIQEVFENHEWASMSGMPMAYTPHLRRAPLAGMPAKSVLAQFGKGDRTGPNPAQASNIRAGDLADRATFYRHDLAVAEVPSLPRDPHTFLGSVLSTIPLQAAIARGYLEQIATFFASDGKTIIHPEPARFFEVPIKGPLPEELNYIA
jgi:hypothetical protein